MRDKRILLRSAGLRIAALIWVAAEMCSVGVCAGPALHVRDGLVFCPLRNIWVKPDDPSDRPSLDLSRICTSEATKRRFILRARLVMGTIAEPAFFDFASRGNGAAGARRDDQGPRTTAASGAQVCVSGSSRTVDHALIAPRSDAELSTILKARSALSILYPSADELRHRVRGLASPRAPPTSL